MLSFIVGHREVNIPQFSQHIFYEVYSQYYIFCVFFFHSVFSFLHFLHGLCMWAGASSFFFIWNLSSFLLACMVTKYKRKSMIEKKYLPSGICSPLQFYLMQFLFSALPLLFDRLVFLSFILPFILSLSLDVSFGCVCVCVFFYYYYSFLKHIYTYIDK